MRSYILNGLDKKRVLKILDKKSKKGRSYIATQIDKVYLYELQANNKQFFQKYLDGS